MKNYKTLFAVFSLTWLIINLLQAIFTEIMNDEAYYAIYGEHLAWGYFDHPPMVALMTFLSSFVPFGNLSVRLMTIVVQYLALWATWRIIARDKSETRKVLLFFIIAASMVMLSAYGFIAAPDVPFLLFTALFLLAYKRFLYEESFITVLLLAFSIAAMMYSKYHGALVVLLVLASNPKLILKYKAWLAIVLAVLLFLPHLLWQINADFPSFRYHLADRNSAFRWQYFLEFLPNQLAVFNPFALGAVIYIFIKYRPQNAFERALYFIIVGFVAFFWAMCLRGHVEPHWTVIATIPMIILLYKRSLTDLKLRRFVHFWFPVSIGLIFVARILLVTNVLPPRLDFNGKADKMKKIETVAGDLPVVFTGSFQNASLYHYFTKKPSFVLSAINTRKTQFDILQQDVDYQGKTVFICANVNEKSKEYDIDGYKFSGYKAENFQSVNRLKISFLQNIPILERGTAVFLKIKIANPTPHDVNFNHAEFPVTLRAAFWSKQAEMHKKHFEFVPCVFAQNPISILPAHSESQSEIAIVVPTELQRGAYSFTLTLDNGICTAQNADYQKVTVN